MAFDKYGRVTSPITEAYFENAFVRYIPEGTKGDPGPAGPPGPPGGAVDATTTTKGSVQLAGDLSGTASAPTVPGLAGKAPLASPSFTGTPTAPTQAAGNNSTRLATTAFVSAALSALVDAAPGTLDTLNELAAALGDDPNFAATVTAALGSKVSTSDAPELIRDTVAAALVAGANVTITPNDAGDTITIAAAGGGAAGPTVIQSVIVNTGTETRPVGPDVVIWIDADELGAANALATDPIITPGASGGTGAAANPTFFASSIPPVASRWIIPPFAENDGHDPASTGGVTAGRMSLQRWEFAEPVIITGFATEVQGTPGAGGVIRFGVYDSLTATAPVPGSEVTVVSETGGYKTATGIAVSVPAGEYWVACAVQGAKAMVRHFKPTSFYRYWDEPHNALQMLGNWSDGAATSRWVNGVTGALPDLSASSVLHPWEGPLAVTVRIG